MSVLENMSMAYNKGKSFNFTFGLEISKIELFKEKLASLSLGIEDQLETRVSLLSRWSKTSNVFNYGYF